MENIYCNDEVWQQIIDLKKDNLTLQTFKKSVSQQKYEQIKTSFADDDPVTAWSKK